MPIKRKTLRRILTAYDAWEEESRGKGSHTMFFREVDGAVFSYPIPKGKEIKDCYVRGVRKKLKLTHEDGVSDEEFFSHG